MNGEQRSAALKAVDGFLKSRGVHLGAVSTLDLVELMGVALATQPPQDERWQVYAKCWVCRMPMDGKSEDDCHCFHRKELAASAPAQQAGQREPIGWLKPNESYAPDAFRWERTETYTRPVFANQPQPVVLEDIEKYRVQMAGIMTASLGYWKEGDPIHPDYDTIALRDVAKLYAKYDALFQARDAAKSTPPQPVAAKGLTGEALIRSAQALLNLDTDGALVPHGIGGHARTIIQAFINQEAMK